MGQVPGDLDLGGGLNGSGFKKTLVGWALLLPPPPLLLQLLILLLQTILTPAFLW